MSVFTCHLCVTFDYVCQYINEICLFFNIIRVDELKAQ
jgi:hypothetical protein